MDKTHRDKARTFLKNGDIKQAIKLAKTFDITYTKDEISILAMTYEILCGKGNFYKQIGINIEQSKQQSINLLYKLK